MIRSAVMARALRKAAWAMLKKRSYDVIQLPHAVSAFRLVPAGIVRPSYALVTNPITPTSDTDGEPPILAAEDIEHLRAACSITKRALDFAATLVKPGVTTDKIDEQVHEFIVQNGAYPSPLGYLRFPKSICTSVNNVIW